MPRTTPPRMTAEQRNQRNALILQMFLAGWSEREIARHGSVKMSGPGVHYIIKQELKKAANRHSLLQDEALAIYIERSEALLKATWPQAMRGELKAIETARRLLETQGRIFDLEEEGKIPGIPPMSDQELDGDDEDELARYRQRHRQPAVGES